MTDTAIEGSCHCGAITIRITRAPTSVSECNCSLCRRIGGLWHYLAPSEVAVAGEAKGYIQGDCMLTNWHCPTCGCTTHWTAIDPDYNRMAVNMRMFAPEIWESLPREQIDGASF